MTILGIDLGTTNSLCAVYMEDKPVIIPNVHGEYMTPSVIAINEKAEILVGKSALEYSFTNKYQCVKSFKRYMGSNKTFQLGNTQYRAEELSAIILKNLKKDAEISLKQEVTSAIISVPAYFNNKQRQATTIAAELAGLKVIRLINEPTAAALSYGILNKLDRTKYLIFDLGGGTFDVTIMELFNGVLEVRSSAGDNFLGGDDFTDLIVNDFCKHTNLEYMQLGGSLQAKLWLQAENCKINIYETKHENKDYEISIEYMDILYSHSYTIAVIEELFQPLINRLLQPIKRSLHDTKLKTEELDAIVFVGGASKMPLLAKICAKMFMKLPFTYHDPQQVVALGAATMVAMHQNHTNLQEFVLTDVCPYTLGTSCLAGDEKTGYNLEYAPIIERNSVIPVSKSRTFSTSVDWQKHLHVDVYQGESRDVTNNIKIADFSIDIKQPTKERQDVIIRFSYDMNGILEVQLNFSGSDEKHIFVIKESCGNMTDAEIDVALTKLRDLKIHPREQDINIAILARAERMYEEQLGKKRQEIADRLRLFLQFLDEQNEEKISMDRVKFNEFLNICELEYE